MSSNKLNHRVISIKPVSKSRLLKSVTLNTLNKSSKSFFFDEYCNIYEVIEYCEDLRSWFIDDYVIEKGSMMMITHVDPLYLLLPFLIQNQDRYRSLVDLLSVCNSYHILVKSIENNNIDVSVIADVKENDNIFYFKYNEDKTLNWLKFKIKLIVDVLKKLNISVSNRSDKVIGFDSGRKVEIENICYLKYAIDLINLYIEKPLGDKLSLALNIEYNSLNTAVSTNENVINKKRSITEANEEPTENYYQQPVQIQNESSTKKSKMSRSIQQLMKVDKTGMKSISSYFSKK